MIKSSFRLPLLGLVLLVAAGLLVSSGRWRGLFVSRGGTEPVFISRTGGAGGEAQVAPSNGPSISGPWLVTVPAASFDGDVRSLPLIKPADKPIQPELEVEGEELRRMQSFEDDAAQQPGVLAGGPAMPAPIRNFDGLNYNTLGSGFPPDTNGDVGPNHYVQTVNTGVGIYSKTTGTQLAAFSFDALFSGTSTPCDDTNNGDPVVLYDAAADRWLLTDFAWTDNDNGPYYECIAASKTSDPTGAYWLYALRADDPTHNFLNDYPKLGVWSDGIYMSANMFDCQNNCGSGTSYVGSRAWALNRDDLYSGAVLRSVVFDVVNNAFTMLPSNFRGAAPPAGRPNLFVAQDDNIFALDVYKFHVDWVTLGNSTFTGPTKVAVANFSSSPNTIPEQSGNNLDSLGTRLMVQNQYQNRAGVESLWLSHTAGKAAPNIAGVRWYQLNVTGGTVNTTPVQQSTFRPDSKHRWMPSLAVDSDGNMAIGYSVSSSSQFPAIQFSGRLAGDPVNTLNPTEGLIIAGGGAQTNNCGGPCERWGDYSAMTIDPVDGCTFWYTTEYYASSGSDWHTRIGSFKYPSCGGVAPVNHFVYLPTVLRIAPAAAWQTITQEDFEGSFPGALWSATDPGLDEFFWAPRDCRPGTGSKSGWAMGGGSLGSGLACGSNYIDNANSWLIYGPFSLADATAAEFSLNLFENTTGSFDRVCLAAATDEINYYGDCQSGSTGGVFEPHTLDLSNVFTLGNLLGNSDLRVAVVFQSTNSTNLPEGAYVDDIVLRQCLGGTCPATPSQPAAPGSQTVLTHAVLNRPDTAPR